MVTVALRLPWLVTVNALAVLRASLASTGMIFATPVLAVAVSLTAAGGPTTLLVLKVKSSRALPSSPVPPVFASLGSNQRRIKSSPTFQVMPVIVALWAVVWGRPGAFVVVVTSVDKFRAVLVETEGVPLRMV